jgi:predicted TIM-barrel enzyme
MPRLERQAILAKLQTTKKAREPIIGGGAGTGLSAKCEEAGDIDLIVIYNSGRYRMAGRGLSRWCARLRQRRRDRAGAPSA